MPAVAINLTAQAVHAVKYALLVAVGSALRQ